MSLRSQKLLEHAALDLRVLQVVRGTPGITVSAVYARLSAVYARLNLGTAPTMADVDRSLQRLRKRGEIVRSGLTSTSGWEAT